MADTIRTGIVGATVTQGGSGWGANAHVPALHLLPDYTLQAVCTAHEDTAQASKAKFDAVYAFHDIDAMAQHPEIDLVVVCVRVPGHKHLVMASLHANKAVFCEWPLGATLAEAQEMATFAKAHGLKTMVGLQARSDPTLMYARDLIHEGYIGDVPDGEPERDQPAGAGARRGPHLAGRPHERRQHAHDCRGPRHRWPLLRPGRVRGARRAAGDAYHGVEEHGDGPRTCPSTRPTPSASPASCSRAPRCRCTSRRSPSTPAAHAWRSTAATGRW
jgi:hypothetical protein